MSVPHWLAPPPPGEPLPRDQVIGRYRYWRFRQLFSTYWGYVSYYFMRKNIPVAIPLLKTQLGISSTAIGSILTAHDLIYGLAKYLAGTVADRANPRILLALGLFFAAAANLGFGLASSLTALSAFWILNGFFQGFGFPPSARVLTHWFRPAERGLRWGIFNTSHQVGTIAVMALSGYWGSHYGWRYCFFFPAIIGLLAALFIYLAVRDTPASLGLPPVDQPWDVPGAEVGFTPAAEQREEPGPIGFQSFEGEPAEEDLSELVRRRVYRNPAVWLACLANFFVYTVRFGILNWAPTYLTEVKHCSLLAAGVMSTTFELAGVAGCLVAGWVTDRFCSSRRAPACFFWMLACVLFIIGYWKAPEGHLQWSTFCLAGVGFTVYGPQFLGGLMSADLAGKRAAGTAVGFHGFFGYLSGFLSGVGMSALEEHYGWDAAYGMLTVAALLGALIFIPIWNARPVQEAP
jgi:sugar phosphate permease